MLTVRQGVHFRQFRAETPMLSEPLFLEVREPPPNMQNRIPPQAQVLPLY